MAERITSAPDLSFATDAEYHFARVRVRGVDAILEIEFDADELRRRGFRPAPETKLDAYNILARMPVGTPQHKAMFSGYEWRALMRTEWAVRIDVARNGETFATRTARPPVTIRRASVVGRSWAAALGKATRFAPYCERRIVLQRLPGDDVLLKLEASYLGVGVAVAADAPHSSPGGVALESVVPAAPFLPLKFTGAAWKFAETVFGQIQPGAWHGPPGASGFDVKAPVTATA